MSSELCIVLRAVGSSFPLPETVACSTCKPLSVNTKVNKNVYNEPIPEESSY